MTNTGKIKILVIDRTRTPFLKEAQKMYIRRLTHYTTLDWVEIKAKPYKELPLEKILNEEALSIRKKISPKDYVIALDKDGHTYSSETFASHLLSLIQTARPIVFIIGGPLGIHDQLLRMADERLSLSSMTFTHEWARVMLLEQIYRGFTIIRGQNYHK